MSRRRNVRITVAAIFRLTSVEQGPPAGIVLASRVFSLLYLLCLGAALLLTAGIALFTANRQDLYRRVALLQLRGALLRDVRVGEVRLDPAKGVLEITDLAVADPTQPKLPFIAARRATVRFSPSRLLIRPLQPLSAVRSVQLEAPFLYLARNRAGRWNFQDLLERPRRKKTDDFLGEIRLEDGQVVYRDARGWKPAWVSIDEHLVGVRGRIIRSSAKFYPFRLEATVRSGKVRTLGIGGSFRLGPGRGECQLHLGRLQLAYLQKYFPRGFPVTLEGGEADGRVQLVLNEDARHRWESTMTLLADVRNARGRLRLLERSWPFVAERGQLALGSNVLELTGVQVTTAGLPVTIDGTISNFTRPALALLLRTERADAARLCAVIPGLSLPGMRVRGLATGWAQLTGGANAVRVTGHVTGPSLAKSLGKSELLLTDVAGDFRFDGATLALSNLHGRSLGGEFAGDGWLALDPTNASAGAAMLLRGLVGRVRVPELLRLFPREPGKSPLPELDGTLAGPLSLSLAPDGALTLLANAEGTLTSPALGDGRVNATVRLEAPPGDRPARTTVERAIVLTAGGVVQAHGTLDDDRLDFAVQGNGIDLTRLARQCPSLGDLLKDVGDGQLAGTGFVTAAVTGTLADPQVTGALRAQHGRAAGRDFAEASGTFSLRGLPPAALTLRQVRVLTENRQLELSAGELSATVDAQTGRLGQWHLAQARLSRSSLASLAALAGLQVNVDGFIDGSITSADFPGEAGGTGRIELMRPSLQFGSARFQYDQATVEFALRDAHTLEITGARLEYEGLPGKKTVLAASGRLSNDPRLPPGEQLALQIAGADLPAENLVAFTSYQQNIGTFSPDGRIRLPFGLAGGLSLDARVTAQLIDPEPDPEKRASPGDLLARTLAVTATLHGSRDFTLSSVPYREFDVAVRYDGGSRTLALDRFLLAPGDGARNYVLAAEPGTFVFSDPPVVNLHLLLRGRRPDAGDRPQPADLDDLRRDLTAVAHNALAASEDVDGLAPVAAAPDAGAPATEAGWAGLDVNLPHFYATAAKYLDSIQKISGSTLLQVDVLDSLEHPDIRTTVHADDLIVNGQVMPAIDADLDFDMAPRLLTVHRLVLTDRAVPDAQLEVVKGSNLQFPDPLHQPMKLTLEGHKINPAILVQWFPTAGFDKLGGTVDLAVTGAFNRRTQSAEFVASVDWFNPSFQGRAFETINATFALGNDPGDPGRQRLWIGASELGDLGFVTIPLKGSKDAPSQALELSGSLPFSWDQPGFLRDRPFDVSLRVPKQSLAAVKYYVPQADAYLPAANAGTVEGLLRVGGTLDRPEFGSDGRLQVSLPALTLPGKYFQTPRQLRNVAVDIGFHAERNGANGRPENVIDINRLSVDGEPLPDDRSFAQRLIDSVRKSLGRLKPKPPVTPRIYAAGNIRLRLPETGVPTFKDLQYDLYARTAGFPLDINQHFFRGNVISYLHLRSRDGAQPLLTGMVKADDSTVTYAKFDSAPVTIPKLAVDPELSVLVELGSNNAFELIAGKSVVHAWFSLTPTGMQPFTPEAIATPLPATAPAADRPYFEYSPFYDLCATSFDRQLAIDGTSGSLEAIADRERDRLVAAGSFGKVTGPVSHPSLEFNFVLPPRKSYVQLPGGLLTVDSLDGVPPHGIFKYEVGSEAKPVLEVQGEVVANIDQMVSNLAGQQVARYVVGLKVKQDLYHLLESQGPADASGGTVARTDTSLPLFYIKAKPTGAPNLSDDQIRKILFGVPDIMTLFKGAQGGLLSAEMVNLGGNVALSDLQRLIGDYLNLESFSIKLNAYGQPEATLTTSELIKSRLGAIRLGAARTFPTSLLSVKSPDTRDLQVTQQNWKLWLIYNIDNPAARYRWLRDLSLTAEMVNWTTTAGGMDSNRTDLNLNLSYQLPFALSAKGTAPPADTAVIPGNPQGYFRLSPPNPLPLHGVPAAP